MSIINTGDIPINENQVDGTELARRLERLYAVVHSQNSNATRPPSITAGGIWTMTVTDGFDVMVFDGTNDVKIGSVANGNPQFGGFETGTKLLFQQSSAPLGWTKDTAHNNKALRVVTGAVSSGGSVDFTTAFTSQAVSGSVGSTNSVAITGSVGATTLTINEMPSHTHGLYGSMQIFGAPSLGSGVLTQLGGSETAANGGGGAHSHSFGGSSHSHTSGAFTGTPINLAVKYVDVIIATKD